MEGQRPSKEAGPLDCRRSELGISVFDAAADAILLKAQSKYKCIYVIYTHVMTDSIYVLTCI
jgi:hypothetical protein